jgi:hypothetical protein
MINTPSRPCKEGAFDPKPLQTITIQYSLYIIICCYPECLPNYSAILSFLDINLLLLKNSRILLDIRHCKLKLCVSEFIY